MIKIKAYEAACNATANSFSNASLVRLVNIGTTAALITVANSTANVGTITMLANSEMQIQKNPTDTLVSNNNSNVLATSGAFTY